LEIRESSKTRPIVPGGGTRALHGSQDGRRHRFGTAAALLNPMTNSSDGKFMKPA
jgi:hypothetical protein